MQPTTAIALSGGIDSLVSAALLKEQGHRLIGLHFLTGYERDAGYRGDQNTRIHKRLVAMTAPFEIPIHIIDLHRDFKSLVVDYFTATYGAGRTPNPCLVCNPLIKFDILFQKARALGAQSLATGHYARIDSTPDGRYRLRRGVDPLKDQSYFLARLTQTQLGRAVLPLGRLTKNETRHLARQRDLTPSAPEESQDICFIKDGQYAEFIEQQPGFGNHPGPIEDLAGNVIGRHEGLHRFTVGQRRGINCPAEAPYYVRRLDTARNRLVVGFKHEVQVSFCRISDINWIVPCPREPITIEVQLRYRHTAVKAALIPMEDRTAEIQFEAPQASVSPGQGAVFYQDDEVLGGGWIE